MANKPVAGQTFSSPFLIKQFSTSVGKNGTFYMITLQGEEGVFDARWWTPDQSIPKSKFKPGNVIGVTGSYSEYQGKMQIKIDAVKPSPVPADTFSKKTKLNVEDMWQRVKNEVEAMTEPLTKFVLQEILLKSDMVIEAVKKAPAAKAVHNDWYGGLLEHINALVELGNDVCRFYKKVQPRLSRDKVMFGLIAHDLGKIVEYDYSNPAFAITEIGILTNHIVIIPAWIHAACNRFPGRTEMENFTLERAQLMHLVAAHHGSKDWGSPVVPSTLEAIIIHHLDNLDSKFMHAVDLIEQGPEENERLTKSSYYEKTRYLIPQEESEDGLAEEDEPAREGGEAANTDANEGSPDSIDDGVC